MSPRDLGRLLSPEGWAAREERRARRERILDGIAVGACAFFALGGLSLFVAAVAVLVRR